MAYVYKNGLRWRAQIDKGGTRLSASFDTKREATEWAAAKESEIVDGKAGKVPDKTFGQLLQKYREEISPKKRSGHWEIIRLKLVERYPIAKVPLRELDARAFVKLRDKRLEEVSPASVRREWNILNHACNIAMNEWKWLRENPMKGVQRPKPGMKRKRLPTPEEIELLKLAAGYPGDTLTAKSVGSFLFACETGMRAGEICGLTAIKGRVAHLPITKNGQPRDVPLSPEALAIWKECGPFTMEPRQLDALWRKVRGKTPIEDLHFHDSRHAAATKLAQKLHILDLCRAMGWSNPKEAMTYYDLSAEDLAAKL